MIAAVVALALALAQWPGVYTLRQPDAEVWDPDAVVAAPVLPSIGIVSVDALGLAATVVGVVRDASTIAWSIAPATGLGTCIITDSLFTCAVVRPALSSSSQTLTLTATGPGGERILTTGINFL